MEKVVVQKAGKLAKVMQSALPTLKYNDALKLLRQKDVKVNGVRVKENVDVVAGPWTETLLGQYEAFPESKFKDLVDAGSNAFNELEKMNTGSAPPTETAAGGVTAHTSYWFK